MVNPSFVSPNLNSTFVKTKKVLYSDMLGIQIPTGMDKLDVENVTLRPECVSCKNN